MWISVDVWLKVFLTWLVAVLFVQVRGLHFFVYHLKLLLYRQNLTTSFLFRCKSFTLVSMILFGLSYLLMKIM